MGERMSDGYARLTDKEKQTLRLIVRGHDAKSIARQFNLSVHTVNERLRDARRKMATSSSREAARLLLDREGLTPELLGDRQFGDAGGQRPVEQDPLPENGSGRARRLAPMMAGVGLMILILPMLAVIAVPLLDRASPPAPVVARIPTETEVETSARNWLALVDQGRWEESWKATGTPFRKLNTSQVWASVSERVRAPLGAMLSRTLISQENVPAPPEGYEVIKFRTSFANKADAVETLSLIREEDGWRVVGITIA